MIVTKMLVDDCLTNILTAQTHVHTRAHTLTQKLHIQITNRKQKHKSDRNRFWVLVSIVLFLSTYFFSLSKNRYHSEQINKDLYDTHSRRIQHSRHVPLQGLILYFRPLLTTASVSAVRQCVRQTQDILSEWRQYEHPDFSLKIHFFRELTLFFLYALALIHRFITSW